MVYLALMVEKISQKNCSAVHYFFTDFSPGAEKEKSLFRRTHFVETLSSVGWSLLILEWIKSYRHIKKFLK